MPTTGDIIEFNRKKQFKYIKSTGEGGTGDTHLFLDETTGIYFVIKKYVPKDLNFIHEHYKRFVDEIKILFNLSHPNIVRVYNYYLYPEHNLGYIQMEYIEGVTIDKYDPSGKKGWDDIFVDVVSAFEYLESNRILHRDIRPANILIDINNNVKVIDFGFGKKLENTEYNGRSVLLNWPVTELPEELLLERIYNHQSEVYFIGKLFQHLIGPDFEDFKFSYIINNMIMINPNQRYKSFKEVSAAISKGIINKLDFSSSEKSVYLKFADKLKSIIAHYVNDYSQINDINTTINLLSNVIRDSSLEKFIQSNIRLIRCFISGEVAYTSNVCFEVSCVEEFYELLVSLPPYKQKVVIDSIYTRLSTIAIQEELPF